MDFGPAVYRVMAWARPGFVAPFGVGWGSRGFVDSGVRGRRSRVRGSVGGSWVRGRFVGGSWEVRGFVGSWVSGWVRGFVDSFARFRVRGVSFPKASAKGSRLVRKYTGEKLHHRPACVPANREKLTE